MVSPSPRKAGGFRCVVAPRAHSRTRPLQKEKSKDFRNHVTKYLETLLNSQQQVSRPSPLMGFTPRISAAPAVKVLPSPQMCFASLRALLCWQSALLTLSPLLSAAGEVLGSVPPRGQGHFLTGPNKRAHLNFAFFVFLYTIPLPLLHVNKPSLNTLELVEV